MFKVITTQNAFNVKIQNWNHIPCSGSLACSDGILIDQYVNPNNDSHIYSVYSYVSGVKNINEILDGVIVKSYTFTH